MAYDVYARVKNDRELCAYDECVFVFVAVMRRAHEATTFGCVITHVRTLSGKGKTVVLCHHQRRKR